MITLDLADLPTAGQLQSKTDEKRVKIANWLLTRVLDDCNQATQRGKYKIEFHCEMPEYQPCDEEMEGEILEALRNLGFKRKDGIYITWRD